MSGDSFDIYKKYYSYGYPSTSPMVSVSYASASCTALDSTTAQCSYPLAGNGLSSGYSYYFYVNARTCVAGGKAVSTSSVYTTGYYTAARRRLLHSDVSSDVSSEVAPHVADHLSRACDACNDYAAVLGDAAVVIADSGSSRGGGAGRAGTGRKLQQAENQTVSSNSTGPVGLPPPGWFVPRVLSACEKAGGDNARLSDGTCDSWMNIKACKYDGESQMLLN
jgi:hypothetical protein